MSIKLYKKMKKSLKNYFFGIYFLITREFGSLTRSMVIGKSLGIFSVFLSKWQLQKKHMVSIQNMLSTVSKA